MGIMADHIFRLRKGEILEAAIVEASHNDRKEWRGRRRPCKLPRDKRCIRA